MKRGIVTAVLVFICFILQTSVFELIKLAGIAPNILLIFISSIAVMRGQKPGMIVGFFSGLLMDIFYGSTIGGFAFLYMMFGFVDGFFHRIYYVEDVLLPMIMISLNDFIYNIIIYVVFFLMRNRLDFLGYLKDVMLPEMIYTILITLFFYKILVRINLRLKRVKEAEQL